jgi:hypothetical protein
MRSKTEALALAYRICRSVPTVRAWPVRLRSGIWGVRVQLGNREEILVTNWSEWKRRLPYARALGSKHD